MNDNPMEVRNLELVFPEHANPGGSAFGGFVMGLMDKVAWYAATRFARQYCVTVSVSRVTFEVPIRVGDLLELVARVVDHGRTSVRIEVEVYREEFGEPEGGRELATGGELVFVAVDDDGNPVPINTE